MINIFMKTKSRFFRIGKNKDRNKDYRNEKEEKFGDDEDKK